jgi:TP901 family phage tail tape measure protein
MASASGIRAGAAFVELYLNDAKLVSGLRKAQAKLKAFSASVTTVGRAMLSAATVAAVPFALSAHVFGGFADKMAEVRAVTGATGADFKKLTDLAKELGRTTSFTAQQVAEGMTELGRAGYKSVEIMAAIPDVLNLARGTATDLGMAAEIAAAAMRGFGLSAEDTTRIADVLTATANNSAQTLEDVGESLKYVAPLAMEAGESLEDTAAAIGVMANNGIKGSMAGTALARAYKNLATESAQKKLKELGVEAVDQAGNLRKVASILAELGERVQGMGSAQRLAIFEELFGRGQAAALKLAAPGADFSDLQKTLEGAQGTAERTAKTMDDTLGGSFRMLMSAVEGVQIAIGEALEGTLRAWMDRATELAGKITALVEANRGFIVSALKIVVVVGAFGAALLAVGTAGSALAFVFGGIISIISAASTIIGLLGTAFAALLSPIGIVIAAVVGLGAYLLYATGAGAQALDWLGEKFGELQAKVQTVFSAIGDALAAGDIALAAKVLWLALRVEWEKGLNYLNTLWETLYVTAADVFDRIATSAVDVFDTIYVAVRNAVDGIYKLILGVGEFIGKAFWTAVQGVVDSFAYVLDKIMTAGYALHLIDDAELVKLDRSIKNMKEGAKGFTDAQKQQAESFYQEQIGAADTRQQQRNQELNQRTIGREQDYAARTQARDQAYTADLAASEEALRQARAEWLDAVDEASRKRNEAESESGAKPEPETPGLIEELKKKLGEAGQATASAAERAVSVQGTFNASALLGLQSGSVADRTAKATEETAKNTKHLLDEAKLGGLTFS